MAHLHNHANNRSNPSMLTNIGHRVQHVAEFAGTWKGIYDFGRMASDGFKVAAPAFAGVAGLL